MPDPIARMLVIHGRVQGVFFRDSLRRRAEAEGVSGWAANRADGTVAALLEGAPDRVERVIDYCRQGPPRAAVERVEIRPAEPERREGFQVR